MTPFDWDRDDEGRTDRGLSWIFRATRWRVVASILAPVAWLAGTLLFFGFWAGGLTWVQDIVVGIVSVVLLLGTMIALWVTFGFRVVRHWIAE